MITSKNFLTKLRDFGLNTYESRLWTALLSRGSSTAGELSDIANVPRSRAYDVLETLERKGFVVRKLGKPIKYLAIPPEDVLVRIKDQVQKQANEHVLLIESLKGTSVLDELNALHEKNIQSANPVDLTGAITGRENIHHHLASRLAKAESTVSLMMGSPAVERKLHILIPVAKLLKEKGVRMRIMTQMTKAMDELSKVAHLKKADTNARMAIIDGKEFVAFLLDKAHPAYEVAIWAQAEPFASQLQHFFEEKWKSL